MVFDVKKLNDKIGGSKISQHLTGEAVDFDYETYGINNKRLLHSLVMIQKLSFDQLILEFGNWIHISYSSDKLRKSILEAYKVKGKIKYRELSVADISNFLNYDLSTVLGKQNALHSLGFYYGKFDAIQGKKTNKAIGDFYLSMPWKERFTDLNILLEQALIKKGFIDA